MKNAEKIAKWCNKNPIKVYANYWDELTDDMVADLLQGKRDSFWEKAFDYEIEMQDSDLYEYTMNACFEQLDLPDSEKNKYAFNESVQWDFTEFWKTCANNSSCHIVAIPLIDGEPIEGPHSDNSEEDNKRIKKVLIDTFGLTDSECDKTELTYSNEVLKFCGTIDLEKVLESDCAFDQITIGPDDSENALFHSSRQGSGNMGPFPIKKTVTLPCALKNDKKSRYGVDSVYGFTESFWSHELKLSCAPKEETKTA